VFGMGLVFTYDIDPSLAGRYALSMAPLLVLVLAAALVGKLAQRVVAGFAAALFLTTLEVMLT
jgi:hypothetical protein